MLFRLRGRGRGVSDIVAAFPAAGLPIRHHPARRGRSLQRGGSEIRREFGFHVMRRISFYSLASEIFHNDVLLEATWTVLRSYMCLLDSWTSSSYLLLFFGDALAFLSLQHPGIASPGLLESFLLYTSFSSHPFISSHGTSLIHLYSGSSYYMRAFVLICHPSVCHHAWLPSNNGASSRLGCIPHPSEPVSVLINVTSNNDTTDTWRHPSPTSLQRSQGALLLSSPSAVERQSLSCGQQRLSLLAGHVHAVKP